MLVRWQSSSKNQLEYVTFAFKFFAICTILFSVFHEKIETSAMSHKCIMHYPSIQISNPNKVTKKDKTRFDKLIKAKNTRVKLGGTYFISRNVRIYRINLRK